MGERGEAEEMEMKQCRLQKRVVGEQRQRTRLKVETLDSPLVRSTAWGIVRLAHGDAQARCSAD